MEITPISHAYSTSNWLAMMMKFWSIQITRMIPSAMANVITVVAKNMQVRLAKNDSVNVRSFVLFISFEKKALAFALLKTLDSNNLMKIKLRNMEKIPQPTMSMSSPKSTRASQSDFTLRSVRYLSITV